MSWPRAAPSLPARTKAGHLQRDAIKSCLSGFQFTSETRRTHHQYHVQFRAGMSSQRFGNEPAVPYFVIAKNAERTLKQFMQELDGYEGIALCGNGTRGLSWMQMSRADSVHLVEQPLLLNRYDPSR